MSPFFAHSPKTTSSSSSITQGGGGERRNQSIEREFFFASFPPLSPPATATDNFSGPLPTSAPTSPPSSGPPLAVVVVGQVVLRSAHYSLSLFHFPHCCIFVPPLLLLLPPHRSMFYTHGFHPSFWASPESKADKMGIKHLGRSGFSLSTVRQLSRRHDHVGGRPDPCPLLAKRWTNPPTDCSSCQPHGSPPPPRRQQKKRRDGVEWK